MRNLAWPCGFTGLGGRRVWSGFAFACDLGATRQRSRRLSSEGAAVRPPPRRRALLISWNGQPRLAVVVLVPAGAARLPAGDELEAAGDGVDCLRVAAVCGVDRVDSAAGPVEGGDAAAVG